jgi:hypothetical protein
VCLTRLAAGGIAAVLAWTCASAGAAQPSAELRVETLGADRRAEARLRALDPTRFNAIPALVGLREPGRPITIVIAPEDSEIARATPSWIAGFAHGPSSRIVVFPARSPRYPHDSIEAVVHHEVAHVLIHRAAGEQPVPRWFNEGLATVAERTWTLEDRRQLAWALASGAPVRMGTLDEAFHRGAGEAVRAYALAGAFVRDVMDRHGADAPARILGGLAQGRPFEAAFLAATGEPLAEAERAFNRRVTSWERWIPLLTSPFVLWTVTTMLALYALWVARSRRAERRRRWDEEEIAQPDVDSLM